MSYIKIKKTDKQIAKEILKHEKIEMREIKKSETLERRERAKYNVIETKFLEFQLNMNLAFADYRDKKLYVETLETNYHNKITIIALGKLNATIIESKNASSKAEARSIVKRAKDEFHSQDHLLYLELKEERKKRNELEKIYSRWSSRYYTYENKYNRIKPNYDSLLKSAVCKRAYFEISKKTNNDCASVVLSFLY
jgi:hypothetical protein